MIDIKKLREDPQAYKDSAKLRGIDVDIDRLLALDKDRIELIQKSEAVRSELKTESKPTEQELDNLKVKKQEFEKLQNDLNTTMDQYSQILSAVPNLIASDTPEGGEENNRVESEHGNTKVDFDVKDHLKLGEINDLFNFEAGSKVATSKFYFLKEKALRLWQSILLYSQDVIREEDFALMSVPHMVNYDIAEGTGYMPRGEEGQNYVDEAQKLVMIATSELPLTGYHKDEIIDVSKPVLYGGLSTCYRLEAGAYGKFSKGLYRTHQFEKLEMYIFCTPSDSDEQLQKILSIEEKICKDLELPYRVVRIAAGDLGAPAYQKYDVEYYSPAEKQYRELTSCSNCTDYQSRNLNIRYRNESGELEFVHTLNGTVATSSRLLIAILENYQQANGTVRIPQVLQKYYGAEML